MAKQPSTAFQDEHRFAIDEALPDGQEDRGVIVGGTATATADASLEALANIAISTAKPIPRGCEWRHQR